MSQSKPNILVITCHDLGDYLGCYGTPVETPNLDKLAQEGVTFKQHYATATICSPSRGSLWTGCYAHTHGLMGLVPRGWEMDLEDAMRVGTRSINLLRVFNLRHGLKRELERPSSRYGSTPVDGPVKGKGIMPVWDELTDSYYSRVGWDPETGKPLPETLRSLGLDYLIQDL